MYVLLSRRRVQRDGGKNSKFFCSFQETLGWRKRPGLMVHAFWRKKLEGNKQAFSVPMPGRV